MKLSHTQIEILNRNPVIGYANSKLYPLYGSGEHRSARSLVNKGIGRMCSSSLNWSHQASTFFTFFNYDEKREEYFFDPVKKSIEVLTS